MSIHVPAILGFTHSHVSSHAPCIGQSWLVVDVASHVRHPQNANMPWERGKQMTSDDMFPESLG